MSIKGGGVRRLMEKSILNFHFDYLHPSLRRIFDEMSSPLQLHAEGNTKFLKKLFSASKSKTGSNNRLILATFLLYALQEIHT